MEDSEQHSSVIDKYDILRYKDPRNLRTLSNWPRTRFRSENSFTCMKRKVITSKRFKRTFVEHVLRTPSILCSNRQEPGEAEKGNDLSEGHGFRIKVEASMCDFSSVGIHTLFLFLKISENSH